MKKFLLSGILLAAAMFSANGQASWGTQLGTTKYDLQTNTASPNRIVRTPDGKMTATWTMSIAGDASFTDRGTGYVYFNGTSWSNAPTQRQENGALGGTANTRTGWPEAIVTASGVEMSISHNGDNVGRLRRATQGSGVWNGYGNITSRGTWPRAATSGNYVHVINALFQDSENGVDAPVFYSRSTDNGANWDITELFLEGQEAIYSSVGGDSYAIDAKGDVVAIAVSGSISEPWMIWKSTDNGTNFDTITVLPFYVDGRIAFDGTEAWILLGNTSEVSVLIDNNNKIHTWAPAMAVRTVDNADSACVGNTSSYNSGIFDWLLYWNEDMGSPMVIQGLQPDIDGDGEIRVADVSYYENRPLYGLGIVRTPTSTIDENGNLYVTYFAPVEGVDDGTGNYFYPTQSGDETGRSYTDLYTIVSTNGGVSWSKPIFLAELADPAAIDDTRGTGFEEDAFPTAVKRMGSDNIYHLIWQTDFETGINLQEHHGIVENYIMYHGFTKDELLNAAAAAGTADAYLMSDTASLELSDLGLCGDFPYVSAKKAEIQDVKNNTANAYPNPTSGLLNISLKSENATKAVVVIRNMMGQEVMATSEVSLNKGFSTLQIDLTTIPAGVYTYSVVTTEKTESGRIVKE
jgi:hypothetical protein